MAAVTREAPNRFRIRFEEVASGLKKLFGGASFQVDPFVIARAILQVMRAASMRSAAGRPLVWNDYRVILARDDFEPLRTLQRRIQEEIAEVVGQEARRASAELVGDLCVRLIADEGNELPAGEGVVRVEFAPSDQLAPPRAGELTIRIDCADIVSGELRPPDLPRSSSPRATDTVIVEDVAPPAACSIRWAGGSAELAANVRTILGREHRGAPANFVALRGASAKISKQQLWILVGPASVVVGRPPGANPVAVDGELVRAGEQVEVARSRLEIDLSRGELSLTVTRAGG